MVSTPEEREKRLGEFNSYFKTFKIKFESTNEEKISYIEDAANLVTAIYFRYIDEKVRPILIDDTKIQHYKICANMELAVMQILPIQHENSRKRKFLNSKLAFFVALSFLVDWLEIKPRVQIYEEILKNDIELNAFLKEHERWLLLLKPRFYYPVFSNSQVWRLLDYLLKCKKLLS